MSKVWFITGAGRALGIDIAQKALVAGHSGHPLRVMASADAMAPVEANLLTRSPNAHEGPA